jgi:NADPH-dependent glutamate synthase beta subunit-like oxidoreductase
MADRKVLVIGGGAAGIAAALEEAKAGNHVYLVEASPSIGRDQIPRDKIIHDNREFAVPDIASVKRHNNIEVISNSDVKNLGKKNGHFRAALHCRTSRVDPEKCDACGDCITVCPIHMHDDYNEGLGWRTAIDFFNPDSGDYNIYKEDMPVCQQTCPINLNIRTYVGQIADGKFDRSLATIREKLPFPLSIGRVCPHPCETACNRGYKDEPISICFLKRFVADNEINNGLEPEIQLPEKTFSEKIAIVGGGPCGLTSAYHLARLGYKNVTVFEALPEPGGMFRVGIPEYRLPTAILEKDIAFITRHGITIKTGVRIGKDIGFEKLKKDHDAVLVAIGAHQGMSLGIENENAQGVHEGVTFLRNAALGQPVPNKGRAIVIGGGNVAMDVSRTCVRLGFDKVHLLYRRTRKEMPASPWEVEAAEHEGVLFQYLVAPQRVIVEEGKAVGLECRRMELGEPDATGRRKPVPVEGSAFHVEGDTVFAAIGQVTDNSLVDSKYNFHFGRKQNFEVDPDTFETNVKGVFAAGDAATGADIAIRACAGGKKAAKSIHKYLRSKG